MWSISTAKNGPPCGLPSHTLHQHHIFRVIRMVAHQFCDQVAALRQPGWDIPVLLTDALTEEGVPELFDAIEAHHSWLQESGGLASRRRDRARSHISEVVNRELRRTTWASDDTSSRLEMGLNSIEEGKSTTYSVAQDILGGRLR